MTTLYIRHTDGHWILTNDDHAGPLARFITRPEAILHSSQVIRETGGILRIQGNDGIIEEERHYIAPPAGRAVLAA